MSKHEVVILFLFSNTETITLNRNETNDLVYVNIKHFKYIWLRYNNFV